MARKGGHQSHGVVIVGGGFGGLACARALERKPLDVLLLDTRNYHLFTPLLYQVATSLLNPSEIAYPFRTIFRRSRNVRFRQARVVNIDLDGKLLRAHSGEEFPFDSLVIATGSENNYFSNQDLAVHTLGMKTLPEAMRLRNHLLSCLELAARERSSDGKRPWLTFVVAGGGPTGVEYAGALSELLALVLGRDYPELDPALARIILVEGKDGLLGGFHPKLGEYARRILTDRGIEVRTSTLVAKGTDEGVVLSDGDEIATKMIVWSAGVKPTDPMATEDRSPSHRVKVDEQFRLPAHPDVYVIGDVASVAAGGGELPMLSPPAMQAGRHVAKTIVARASGTARGERPFKYTDKGTMATIGRRAAVADVHGLRLKGTLGWLAWLIVHIYYLIGFRNRASVMASWAGNYLRRDRPIRLILRTEPDPLASSLEAGAQGPQAPSAD